MAKLSHIIAINLISGLIATGAMASETHGTAGSANAQASAAGQQKGGAAQAPAKEAIAACNNKTAGNSCSYQAPQGTTVSGICNAAPSQGSLACVSNG